MSLLTKILTLVLCTLLLASCSTVKFYNEKGIKKESGLRIYNSRIYLVLTKENLTDAKGNTTSSYASQTLALPDFENPQFMKVGSGLGKLDLTYKTSNGVLTDLTINSDARVSENIDAISGLIPNLATIKDLLKDDEKNESNTFNNMSNNNANNSSDKKNSDELLPDVIILKIDDSGQLIKVYPKK